MALGFTLWPGTSHCKNASKSYRYQISAADSTQYSVDWIDYALGEKGQQTKQRSFLSFGDFVLISDIPHNQVPHFLTLFLKPDV